MKLLKFYATWCGPCKTLTKTMEGIELPCEVVSIDIAEDMHLATKYKVRSVPTLILVNENDEPIATKTGSLSKEDIVEMTLSQKSK